MDLQQVFASMPEWTEQLGTEQHALLAKLMETENSKGFAEFSAEEVLLIHQHLLRAEANMRALKDAEAVIKAIKPTTTGADFI